MSHQLIGVEPGGPSRGERMGRQVKAGWVGREVKEVERVGPQSSEARGQSGPLSEERGQDRL